MWGIARRLIPRSSKANGPHYVSIETRKLAASVTTAGMQYRVANGYGAISLHFSRRDRVRSQVPAARLYGCSTYDQWASRQDVSRLVRARSGLPSQGGELVNERLAVHPCL